MRGASARTKDINGAIMFKLHGKDTKDKTSKLEMKDFNLMYLLLLLPCEMKS